MKQDNGLNHRPKRSLPGESKLKRRLEDRSDITILLEDYASKLEQRVQQASIKLARVMDNLVDGYFEIGKDWVYIEMNRRAAEIIGKPKGELIGTKATEHVPHSLNPEFYRQARKAMREDRVVHYEAEAKWTGTWYETDIYPSGEGVSVLTRDITERKEGEQAEARLAAIVRDSDDAIIAKDLKGYIVTWNRGAAKLYGYRAEEVIGKHLGIIVPRGRKKEVSDFLEEIKKGRSVDHYETKRVTQDGRILDVSITVSPMKDNSGEIVGASTVARDITDQKQMEERRRRLEKQRSDFLGVASHELKTPVTSMKAYVQILQRRFAKRGDDDSAQNLARIDAQINKLTLLISDLLDVTKIDSGTLRFNMQRFDYDELVAETVESMQLTTNRHKIAIKGSLGRSIWGDRERLSQVLVNLLSNAIKYSPHSEKITVSISGDASHVSTSVADQGVGISIERQERVFERFFRVSGKVMETFPGLGLGLFISAGIVKRLGGTISVKSKRGKGATFTFSIPTRKRVIKQGRPADLEREVSHE